MGGSQS